MRLLRVFGLAMLTSLVVACQGGNSGSTSNPQAGFVKFSQPSIRMLSNGELDKRYRSIVLEYSGVPLEHDLVINLSSSDVQNLKFSDNLVSDQCVIIKGSNSCAVSITTSEQDGRYQIRATTADYTINPLTVDVYKVAPVHFDSKQITFGEGVNFNQFNLSLGTVAKDYPNVLVKLASNSPHVTVSDNNCYVSGQLPTCRQEVVSDGTHGTYFVYVTAIYNPQTMQPIAMGSDTSPLQLIVGSEDTPNLTFAESSATLLYNHKQKVHLYLVAADKVTGTKHITLSEETGKLSIEPASCELSVESPDCEISIEGSHTGDYELVAADNDSELVAKKIKVTVNNYISFTQDTIRLVSSQAPYSEFTTGLVYIGEIGAGEQVVVPLIPSDPHLSLAPASCVFEQEHKSCEISGTLAKTGAYALYKIDADVSQIPFLQLTAKQTISVIPVLATKAK